MCEGLTPLKAWGWACVRGLTDYLEGDCYYRTDREGQNLDRARVQIKLLRGMEEQFDTMLGILENHSFYADSQKGR